MKLFCFFVLSCWLLFSQNLWAQGNYLAQNSSDSQQHSSESSLEIETYYNQLIDKYGANDRYRACELALQKFNCEENEYHAKLYNTLAEEAVLMRDYEQAKYYYRKVLETDFVANYYTEGLLAERSKLTALAGLRNVAMEEKDFEKALGFHYQYVDSLQRNWGELASRNQLVNDKIFARCYQGLGQSEKAINYLIPYAFGTAVGYGGIDKTAVDALTELLKTKYPKKAYKRFLDHVATQIYTEQKDGKVFFYLLVLENRIYFQNDSANYVYRVAENEMLLGQALAHYQRKLLNSYFYQSLFK